MDATPETLENLFLPVVHCVLGRKLSFWRLRARAGCISTPRPSALRSDTSNATSSHSSDRKFEQLIWEMDISLEARLVINARLAAAAGNTNELRGKGWRRGGAQSPGGAGGALGAPQTALEMQLLRASPAGGSGPRAEQPQLQSCCSSTSSCPVQNTSEKNGDKTRAGGAGTLPQTPTAAGFWGSPYPSAPAAQKPIQ